MQSQKQRTKTSCQFSWHFLDNNAIFSSQIKLQTFPSFFMLKNSLKHKELTGQWSTRCLKYLYTAFYCFQCTCSATEQKKVQWNSFSLSFYSNKKKSMQKCLTWKSLWGARLIDISWNNISFIFFPTSIIDANEWQLKKLLFYGFACQLFEI